ATVTREPSPQVLDTDRDIVTQTGFGDRPLRPEVEQILSIDDYVRALLLVLVRSRHVLFAYGLGDRHQPWVCHPGSVAAVGHFAQLVCTNCLERRFVGRRIIL